MKIVFLSSSGLNEFQQQVLKPILEDRSFEIVGSLIDARPKPSFKKRFLKNLKRGRGGYMLVMFFKSLRRKDDSSVGTKGYFEKMGMPCLTTQEPYSEATILKLKEWQPDVMVMLGGFGIVKEPLLSLAPKGILSYHHGNMRKYRGQPVGFWELYNGEREMGVTVQKLAAGIDKGIPIVERTIPIEKNDDVNTLCKRALMSSTTMMHEALVLLGDPWFSPNEIHEFGPIYTLPNLRQYLKLNYKLFYRKCSRFSQNR